MKAPTWKVFILTKEPENPWDRKNAGPVGSMADWDGVKGDENYSEVEPFEFCGQLSIDDYFRGRSAAGFLMTAPSGARFTIRMKELVKMLKVAVVNHGVVEGRWGFVKQGANYSLTYLGSL